MVNCVDHFGKCNAAPEEQSFKFFNNTQTANRTIQTNQNINKYLHDLNKIKQTSVYILRSCYCTVVTRDTFRDPILMLKNLENIYIL